MSQVINRNIYNSFNNSLINEMSKETSENELEYETSENENSEHEMNEDMEHEMNDETNEEELNDEYCINTDSSVNSNENKDEQSSVIFLLKVNNIPKCYCKTTEEVNDMVNYMIKKISTEYVKNGWKNVKCNTTNENKIKWRIINADTIVTHILGNKPNHMIFHDNVLSSIEVELVENFNNKKHLLDI